MLRKAFAAVVVLAVALLGLAPAAVADEHVGTIVETIARFDDDVAPEGIAVGDDGTVYVSTSGGGQIWKLDDDGEPSVLATIDDDVSPQAFGVLGLWATDDAVYAAAATFNPETHGVWRVGLDGSKHRVPGSEFAVFPNEVAVVDGTVYFTDSAVGGVWRQRGDDNAEPWLVDELLAGTGDLLGPELPIGANGIGYDPRLDRFYVSVSERGRLVAIPVEADGSAGQPWVVAEGEHLFGLDGVTVDANGVPHAVSLPLSNLYRIGIDGTVEVLATMEDGLDTPSALDVGPDGRTLYVVNFAVGEAFGFPAGDGPSVMRVTPPPSVDLRDRDAVAYVSEDQEVPRTGSPAWAWSVWRIRGEGTRIDFSSTIFDLDVDITMAHLHWAPRGQNGPIVVDLTDMIVDRTRIAGSFTAEDITGPLDGSTIGDLVEEIEAGRIYLNIHTARFPAGEIRGQLLFW